MIELRDVSKYYLKIDGSKIKPEKYDDYLQTGGEGEISKSSLANIGNISKSDIIQERIPALTIVGITDRKEPCIYARKALFMQLVSGSVSDAGGKEDGSTENQEGGRLVDYNEYDFKGGTRPENDYEVVVSESRKSEIPVGKTIDRKVDGRRLKVIGYYRGASDDTMILVNTRTFEHSVIEAKSGITVYAKDRESVKNVLEQSGAKVENPYENPKAEYQKKRKDTVKSALILTLNVLFGLLPVNRLLCGTPAEILARNDAEK